MTGTNPNKSLKGGTPHSNMLKRQHAEVEIAKIPLKKNQTLEITNLKLSIHNSKKILLSVSLTNVRSITPIKKDKIRVQFTQPKILLRGIIKMERKYVDLKLDKNPLDASHICRKIQKEHERLNTKTRNPHGFLMVHGWEHIISVYENIKTNKGKGRLYVTNKGVAFEDSEGVSFDVPFEYALMITDHKKQLRVLYKEPWNLHQNFKFDFTMNDKTDTVAIRTQMNRAFAAYRKDVGYAFAQLEKKYGKCTYDEMFSLLHTRNPEFENYLRLHVKHTFGYAAPKFDYYDLKNIMCWAL